MTADIATNLLGPGVSRGEKGNLLDMPDWEKDVEISIKKGELFKILMTMEKLSIAVEVRQHAPFTHDSMNIGFVKSISLLFAHLFCSHEK